MSGDSWEGADADCIGESAKGGEPGHGTTDADTPGTTDSGTVGIGTNAGGITALGSEFPLDLLALPNCDPQLCDYAHTAHEVNQCASSTIVYQ